MSKKETPRTVPTYHYATEDIDIMSSVNKRYFTAANDNRTKKSSIAIDVMQPDDWWKLIPNPPIEIIASSQYPEKDLLIRLRREALNMTQKENGILTSKAITIRDELSWYTACLSESWVSKIVSERDFLYEIFPDTDELNLKDFMELFDAEYNNFVKILETKDTNKIGEYLYSKGQKNLKLLQSLTMYIMWVFDQDLRFETDSR